MTRLDVLCVSLGLTESRTKSKSLIENGHVSVDGKVIKKPSEKVDENANVSISFPEENYVSRGAFKLKGALCGFNIDVCGLVAVDIGASTGGFTQILLENGIKKVYAVDVGKNQLHKKIRENEKVISMEETNARELTEDSFDDSVSLVVMDVSFISQTLIYPAVSRILKKGGIFVSLVKPQFEVGKENIGKGGIVKNEKLYAKLEEKIKDASLEHGLELKGYMPSPIEGGDGNKEFLAFFVKTQN
jgi:23S rRNA (cytidine1920-2'-O)/16S rRNA (cytidine1409-2'-O)-methyltransferase